MRLLSLVWAFFEQMWRRQMLISIHQHTFFNLFVNAWRASPTGTAQIATGIKILEIEKISSECRWAQILSLPMSVVDFYCSLSLSVYLCHTRTLSLSLALTLSPILRLKSEKSLIERKSPGNKNDQSQRLPFVSGQSSWAVRSIRKTNFNY